MQDSASRHRLSCLGQQPPDNSLQVFSHSGSAAAKLAKIFPRWLIAVNVASALVLFIVQVVYPSDSVHDGHNQPRWITYMTAMGVVCSVTHLGNGVRPGFVFIGFLTAMSVAGVISARDVVSGFSRVGTWLPQLQLVIIRGIRDSGILEDTLLSLLGRHLSGGRARLQLYCGALVLSALVGSSATITAATPVVIKWARSHSLRTEPLLLMLVVSATCGNAIFVTSHPSSLVIREMMCVRDCSLQAEAQTPLALLLAIILGVYAAIISERLEDKGSMAQPTTVQDRHGFKDVVELAMTSSFTRSPSPHFPIEEDLGASRTNLKAKLPEELKDSLHYELDFVVMEKSLLCGHTPRSAGLQHEPAVYLIALMRLKEPSDTSFLSDGLQCASTLQDIESWCFDAGDVITARCSAQGVCAMRRYHGVFVLHGLRCHRLLGGRRHERRLFEAVVAKGSRLNGQTLEQLLGNASAEVQGEGAEVPWFVQYFRGFPLAAWRREGRDCRSARPLSASADMLAVGDVVLVDAFQEFLDLKQTKNDFLVAALVPNSQAPRHGRSLDMVRGIATICALILVLVLALLRISEVLTGYLMIVAFLISTAAVQPNQLSDILDWPMLLTIGSGEGVARAIHNSGLLNADSNLLVNLRHLGGTGWELCGLSLGAQLCTVVLSSTPAGMIIASIALALPEEGHKGMTPEMLIVLVTISCNLVLKGPTPDELMQRKTRTFSIKRFLFWDLPVSAIVTATSVLWTLQVYIGPEKRE